EEEQSSVTFGYVVVLPILESVWTMGVIIVYEVGWFKGREIMVGDLEKVNDRLVNALSHVPHQLFGDSHAAQPLLKPPHPPWLHHATLINTISNRRSLLTIVIFATISSPSAPTSPPCCHYYHNHPDATPPLITAIAAAPPRPRVRLVAFTAKGLRLISDVSSFCAFLIGTTSIHELKGCGIRFTLVWMDKAAGKVVLSSGGNYEIALKSNICYCMSKVFKLWDWTSNANLCSKGCRIILGWNKDVVDIMVLSQSSQPMHVKILHKASNNVIFYSFIYAALNLEDSISGSSRLNATMYDFKACVNNIEVMDINSSGLHYTWNQKPRGRGGILKKLDRIMGNMDFVDSYPANVKAFTKAKLDEEHFLKQKAKIKWLDVGDSNSAFFHKFVKSRNRSCRIEVIHEIKSAMFSIGDDRAPGPDGFTSAFFKKSWDIVGDDICKAVRDFFSNGKLLKETNHTFLALIPKEMVSDSQSAFISGRRISDNILITQELMHNYHRDRGPPRGEVDSARLIMESLKEFQKSLRLVPSIPKSTVYYCNVRNHVKVAILNIMLFAEGELPVKYLGVPIISTRLLNRDRELEE
nr:methylenetetrahydrofolate reductase 1 [Tanacetum cinerariifolium]